MSDVTLRIDGDASGAAQAFTAIRQAALQTERILGDLYAKRPGGLLVPVGTAQELQAAAQAAGPAAAGLAQAAQAGQAAGDGFSLTSQQARLLAAQLLNVTGAGRQFGGILTSLLMGAINPVTLGIAGAVLAVQGLMAALQAAQAATEAERRELGRLAEGYAKAADELERLRRLRGEMTAAGGARARREVGAMAAEAGISEEEARAIAEAMPGADEAALLETAQAYAGRPAERAGLTPEQVARRFRRGRRTEERAAWAEAGRARLAEDPAARLREAEAAGTAAAREAEPADAEEIARLAAFLRGRYGEAEAAKAPHIAEILRQWPREVEPLRREVERWEGGGWRPAGIEHLRLGMEYLERGPGSRAGLEVHNHFAGADGPPVQADGRPRGAGE